MKFSGLDELLLNEKIGVECQHEYCTPDFDFINDDIIKK